MISAGGYPQQGDLCYKLVDFVLVRFLIYGKWDNNYNAMVVANDEQLVGLHLLYAWSVVVFFSLESMFYVPKGRALCWTVRV